jgi:hypothetical protein
LQGTVHGARALAFYSTSKEKTMPSIEDQAVNDAMANKNMMDDPNWSADERMKYQAAYTNAKNKTDNK